MFKPHEIAHPLRNIQLMTAENLSMSFNENQLIDRYVKLHNQHLELEKVRQQVQHIYPVHRNFLTELQKEYKDILDQITQLRLMSAQLLPQQSDYHTYKTGFDAIIEGSQQYNDNHKKFIENYDNLAEDMNMIATTLDNYRNSVIEINNSLEALSELEEHLMDNEDGLPPVLDMKSFARDKKLFMEIVTSARSEFDQLFASVSNYIDDDFNPFIDFYIGSTQLINELNNNIQKLQNAYLLYTKAKEADNDLVYLEWQPEKPFQNPEEIIKYGLTYDIEFGKNGGIILHLDSLIVIDDILDIWQRWTYRMKCPMTEVFTPEIMEPLVGHCLEGMRTGIQESVEKNKRNFDMKMITLNYEVVKNVTGLLLEIVPDDHKLLTKDDDMYMPWLRISKPGIFNLLGLTVMNVLDQLLFENKNFENRKNQEKLNKITAIGHYISLRTHIIEMLNNEITLNLRQYTNFLMWMDCVSQLLVGDHEADFIHYLEVANIKAETRMEYLKLAQKHFKEALENFQKKEITVPYLEKTHDWNRIFF